MTISELSIQCMEDIFVSCISGCVLCLYMFPATNDCNENKLIQNQQTIANSFNDYFSTTAEKLMGANQIDMSQLKNGASLQHILRNFRYPYPNIKFRYTSIKEIEDKDYKIIKNKKCLWIQ